MANHMKFCGCRMCRSGRKTAGGQCEIKRAKRKFRHNAKRDLKQGYLPDRIFSVTCTD